ncbi:lysylphosphatidylglycerol synthase transmembrane domain-containing protein [Streptomyces tagetis]|uniref:lysylphosphatidylglycerol synthase transmembrane domain-containing protein n=1 Tax=Streptomyces tagetis TaxID=2820809 RepID=UPI0027DD2368|nr:lysylphosphatidylglycerol synthase transmembrane domain-containing protein [Streptomyces sp. RG38]
MSTGAAGARSVRGEGTARASRWRRALRTVRPHLGTLAGVVLLAVLLWRLGTGAFLDGLRRIDGPTLLAALGIGLVTTVCSAWRWSLVARGLGIRLPLRPAVADYYRALFLNAALPGGVLGDVHRAVRHGRDAGDLRRGVRAVVLERAAGQLALMGVGAVVLLTMASPVLAPARQLAPLAGLAVLGTLAVVLAVRMNRPASHRPGRRGRAVRAVLGEARRTLLSRSTGPGIALSSAVVLAGHLVMFVLAARVAGSAAPVAVLVPLAVLALLAMGLPLNVGGWGPREGVTAWAFGAAGLGAGSGLGVAVVYGVLGFAASLPGAAVLVARRRAAAPAVEEAEVAGAVGETILAGGPAQPRPPLRDTVRQAPGRPGERAVVGRAGEPAGAVGGAEPHHAPRVAYPRSPPWTGMSADVSSEKYAPKESVRLARISFPFSAEPSEGRPTTPESV